jgi:hypothetical protein
VLVGDPVEEVPCDPVWVVPEAFLDDAAVPDRMKIPAAETA